MGFSIYSFSLVGGFGGGLHGFGSPGGGSRALYPTEGTTIGHFPQMGELFNCTSIFFKHSDYILAESTVRYTLKYTFYTYT